MLNRIIKYFLDHQLITFLVFASLMIWGIITAPFDWKVAGLPTDPVPVDAIPDIGENQQVVFTQWQGRSPQDIEDQITYPLTTYLLGIPGVKTVRSNSIFGFSSIYIIFKEEVDFYWSRTRVLEKLSALPPNLLPTNVRPTLGPDATALGQVFWYTLEGQDTSGQPTGGWDLHEIRAVQDFYVKNSLSAVDGVSEVASIGGFVKNYQVEVDPDKLKQYEVSLHQVSDAIRQANQEVGAKTIEINQVEYLVRGLGYVKSLEDLEEAVVAMRSQVPIRVKDLAWVTIGPAARRGILDKEGAEVVGGVVVTRYGANPMETIQHLKNKIKEVAKGLPKKQLADGTESQLTIVPFYDRSLLIQETLGTLEEALSLEILITVLVIIVMLRNVRASVLVASLLPIAVLIVFIAMRYLDIQANIVALSGIAIAIGTMVDLGIILTENILGKLKAVADEEGQATLKVTKQLVYEGTEEVSKPIVTAVATTIVSFLPVFALQAAEGKLFTPLAYTKTFALLAAMLVALLLLPSLVFLVFNVRSGLGKHLGALRVSQRYKEYVETHSWLQKLSAISWNLIILVAGRVTYLLTVYWQPLGVAQSEVNNFCFVGLLLILILGSFALLQRYYVQILTWCLRCKYQFLLLPLSLMILGMTIWLGFSTVFSPLSGLADWVGINLKKIKVWSRAAHAFPGIGKEFMPALNEGSFLLMPSTMPHAGISFNKEMLSQLDRRVANIPEVAQVVGKLGRVESPLDPAPTAMFENVINYKPEYVLDENGRKQRFRVDEFGHYLLKTDGGKLWKLAKDKGMIFSGQDTISLDQKLRPLGKVEVFAKQPVADFLIPDASGALFRNWRAHIHNATDIWDEILKASQLPGLTSAPKLQPIETRLVMLQTGMRAPMGIKMFGPDLNTIEQFGMQLEKILKEIPSVKASAVFAERMVGKPYLHLRVQRDQIAQYGLTIRQVQDVIETAIGGKVLSATIEGRERYNITIRYPRELRDSPEALGEISVPLQSGAQIPLKQLVTIEYQQGPQAIKSEDTFLVGYVLFDKENGYSEITTVTDAQKAIEYAIEQDLISIPKGVSYRFSGNYENQLRAEQRLSIIVPVVLLIVFLILYFQFRSASTSFMVFTAIALAFSGGFILLWLWGQPWFMNFELFGVSMRGLFQMGPIHLSVAVWVGFIALFGIATDDGVLMGTYLDQSLKKNRPESFTALQEAIIKGAQRRIQPSIMTTATTIIALLPILTSTGKGSDIMIPMAIPVFGGMLIDVTSYFIVPVLYAMREEWRLKKSKKKNHKNR